MKGRTEVKQERESSRVFVHRTKKIEQDQGREVEIKVPCSRFAKPFRCIDCA